MTELSRVWTGITVGDATDAPYSDSDWWNYEKYQDGYGASRANYGPFKGNGTTTTESLQVDPNSPAGQSVIVRVGSANVNGTVYTNDANLVLATAANASGNPRIDTVILRKDFAAQTIRAVVKQGTPAATPAPPAMTQTPGVTWEIPLADLTLANGYTTITAAEINPRSEFANIADGVYLDNVLNGSGADLEDGDVVVITTGADRSMTTTTTLDDPNALGVVRGRVSNGAYGRVQIAGIGYVRLNAASATRGLGITTSTTARQGAISVNIARVGYTLEITAGAGRCLALINCTGRRRVDYLKYTDQKTSGTAGGTSAAAAYQTRTLNTEDFDTGNFGTLAANQVTLQPGEYVFYASAPGSNVRHRTRFRNITAGTTVALGSSAVAAGGATTHSFVSGRFVISAATVFEVQQYTATSVATTGLGDTVSSGENEVYTTLELWRYG